ncbi:serine/threonine protein kinase [Chloracidobacterium validum]|uniref:Serine/threonine protein kinase n=1 Tax=Chloracidobacterium validum TaxID=2821543 RepID=A0ABX8BBV7_9BACT|nr:serine/threonine-protein kinase [Chloracidobacterium validum]QUW03020.1 serine/threonine protein kinase [Chloracidobacterium validum]
MTTIPDPFIGVTLDGKYRLDAKIGVGGFGVVYRATHLNLNRPVAVKVLHNNVHNTTPENLERFRQEGVSACSVSHPNAVAILDFSITQDGYAYLVMELLDGRPLSDELQERFVLPLERCVEIIVPVCDVLTEAHASGIVHRDIKPDNIFLHKTRRGEIVKVLDFGIAKLARPPKEPGQRNLTATGILMGTPEYMSPERMRNKPYDGKADVYSLGIMMYQMLSGKLPFESADNDFVAVMWMQVNDPPPPIRAYNAAIPIEVERVILHALEKDPANRPTAEELSQELLAAMGESSFGYSSGKFTLGSATPTSPASAMKLPALTAEGSYTPLLFDLTSTLEIVTSPLAEVSPAVTNGADRDAPLEAKLLPAPARVAEKVGEIAVFTGHAYPNSIAFSRDGRFFHSARRDQTIGMFSTEDGREITRFAAGRMFPVRSVALSPDNRVAVFSGADDSLRLRDAQSGGELRRLFGHAHVTTLAFSPDGRWIVTGGQDKTVRLWEAASGRELRRFTGHADEIACANFSPDGQSVIVLTVRGDIHLWDAQVGRQLLYLPPDETTYDALSVAISDDRQRLVGSEFKQVKATENEARRRIKRLDVGQIPYGSSQFVFTPDGRQVASVNLDSTIRLWQVDDGKPLQVFVGHGNYVNSLALSADGKRLLSGSDDRTIRLWDVESGHEIMCFTGHTDRVHHVMLHPDGVHALSCGPDGTVRRWGLPPA